jgi:nucleoside-diphosphate-sugar epimerase
MIYITGSNGMIGQSLINRIGDKVRKISFREEIKDVFDSHENACLIHLAWSTTTRDSIFTTDINQSADVKNSIKLFNFFINKNPTGKIVFVSSAGALLADLGRLSNEQDTPNLNTFYSKSKFKVEEYLRSINYNSIIIRPTNVWGASVSRERVNGLVDKLIYSIRNDLNVEITVSLSSTINIIHINDLVEFIHKVVFSFNLIGSHTYIVSNEHISIREIIDLLSKLGIIRLIVNKNLTFTSILVDNTKAINDLEWYPKISLKDYIAETIG